VSPQRPPQRALIYHFTHLDNLPSILAEGQLVCDAQMQQRPGFTEVGDLSIKERRRSREIPTGPGGTVADYVPFYFAARSPMMFRIYYDCRDSATGRYPEGVDPLVYLVSSVDAITGAGLHWVASDGNSSMGPTRFTTDLATMAGFIDWPLMEEQYWKNTQDDGDRVRRRSAEFLVHGAAPVSAVIGYAVRTPEREAQLLAVLQASGHSGSYCSVRPDWYPYS
jgi:hypothetical protein